MTPFPSFGTAFLSFIPPASPVHLAFCLIMWVRVRLFFGFLGCCDPNSFSVTDLQVPAKCPQNGLGGPKC